MEITVWGYTFNAFLLAFIAISLSLYFMLSMGWFRRRKDIRGQVVLITGSGSGIGKQMSFEFVKRGCNVVLWDINLNSLEKIASELRELREGVIVHICKVDVTNREEVRTVANEVIRKVGKIDILVNNAGVVAGDFFWNLNENQIERVMSVNALGPMWVTKAFIPQMIERNSGHIVNISSAGGVSAAPKLADYCASKFALFGFNEGLRLELRKNGLHGIKTTVVCPFYIRTGMFEGVKTYNPAFPLLSISYVATSVVNAVIMNQEELFLPNTVKLGFLLRFFVTTAIRDYFLDFLGISKSMDDFCGLRKI